MAGIASVVLATTLVMTGLAAKPAEMAIGGVKQAIGVSAAADVAAGGTAASSAIDGEPAGSAEMAGVIASADAVARPMAEGEDPVLPGLSASSDGAALRLTPGQVEGLTGVNEIDFGALEPSGPEGLDLEGRAPRPQLVNYLPNQGIGDGLATAITGGAPAGQVALGLLPSLGSGLAQYGLHEAGVGAPVDAVVSSSLGATIAGAISNNLDVGNVALAGLGSLADSTIETAINGIPVLGGTGALGGLVNGLINGGDLGDLAIGAAGSVLSNLLPVGSAPFIGSFVAGLTGNLKTPGQFVGPALGFALGGPIGGLIGGFAGGLLDGLFGFGKPKSFTLGEEFDLTGDGSLGTVTAVMKDRNYRYTVKGESAKTLPLRSVDYKLDARMVNIKQTCDSEGESCRETYGPYRRQTPKERRGVDKYVPRNEVRHFVELDYEYEPLFPTTEPAKGTVGRVRVTSYKDGEPWRKSGSLREISADEYNALVGAMGGTEGSVAGSDERAELFRPYVPNTEVSFMQEHTRDGLHYWQDMGNGIRALVRSFPNIEGFREGDDRTEVVEWRFPEGEFEMDYDMNGDGILDRVAVTKDADGDGNFDTARLVELGRPATGDAAA